MDDADRALSIDELAQKRYQERMSRLTRSVHAAPIHAQCTTCGGPIEAARLKVYPHAARCLECQTIYEAHHGR